MWLLNKPPYPAQAEAVKRVEHQPYGYAYFMEMGLGKTAVQINEFVRLKMENKVDKMVVFAPFTISENWAEEVSMWTDGKLRAQVWPWKEWDETADVYILYYEALAVGGCAGVDFLDEIVKKYRVLVSLDESTQIKKHNAKRTIALLQRRKEFAFTRVLSGAPMVQGPQDVWAQLKFIGALDGTNFFQFRHRYCQMGGYRGRQIVGVRRDMVGELNSIVDASAFRAKKEDWLDGLPPKVYHIRKVQHTARQASMYKEMLDDFMVQLDSGALATAEMVVTQMLKLQQISSGFIIDADGVEHPIPGANPKLDEVRRLLDEEIVGKVIIPTYFRYSTRMLMEELATYGAVGIIGGQEKEDVQEAKVRFNSDGSCRVIICQSSSSKYGHTLLGDQSGETPDLSGVCADTIFYENSFSLDDRIQIEDRNHRIGQRYSVNITDLVSSGVESRVARALQRKKALAEEIIDAVKSTRERGVI